MIALIDADTVTYRCAASAENDPLDIALERADSLIERILYETGSQVAELWLTGSNNFRYDINPQYKANRKNKPRPKWLEPLREHLVIGWGAKVSDGNEADDELGISQCSTSDDTVICGNDKDLLTIPGQHFNFVTGVHRIISPHEGLQNFYFQMIMGDTSDNIFGFDGKARSKVPNFLKPMVDEFLSLQTEIEMAEYVYKLYQEHDPVSENGDYGHDCYITNAHCLYIWKKQNDKWKQPRPSYRYDSDESGITSFGIGDKWHAQENVILHSNQD